MFIQSCRSVVQQIIHAGIDIIHAGIDIIHAGIDGGKAACQAYTFQAVGFDIFIGGFTDGFVTIGISCDEIRTGSKTINGLFQFHGFQKQGIAIFFESQFAGIFIICCAFAKNGMKGCDTLVILRKHIPQIFPGRSRCATCYGCRNSHAQYFYIEFFHVFYLCMVGVRTLMLFRRLPVNCKRIMPFRAGT